MKRKKERKKESIFRRKEVSEKIWKYFEESVEMKRSENMWRKDRNFGRRDGSEGNTFERKEDNFDER